MAPATAALGKKDLIITQAPGYRISVTEKELDLLSFHSHLAVARRAFDAGDYVRASFRYSEALCLWRGSVLADLAGEPFVQPIANRLGKLQMQAVEGRIESELSMGHHAEVSGELSDLVDGSPLDERFVGLLMVAQYRAGRQSDALDTFQRCRRQLLELGLDPGQSLRDLEGRILSQDPTLEPPKRGGPDLTLPTILRSSLAVPTAKLLVNGTSVELERPVTTIGRSIDRHVIVDDPKASRNHAEIHREGAGFKIIDRASSNGTLVNGVNIREKVLKSDDEILIGATILRFIASPQ